MRIHSLYPALIQALNGPGSISARIGPGNQALLEALDETYTPGFFGPGGARGALELAAPGLRQALAPAPAYGLEVLASRLMERVAPLLPAAPPDLLLGTLLFMAPAATLSLGGRPLVALGVERFSPRPPSHGPKFWYRPDEAEEMIPHEAAHAARMAVLGLPPTPRRLSLLDMVMLEGTALVFTDLLVGRRSLATFMDPGRLAWHEANESAAYQALASEFQRTGMAPFMTYFRADAPISGYYVGYSLCRRFLDRYGLGAVQELLALDSPQVLRRLDLA